MSCRSSDSARSGETPRRSAVVRPRRITSRSRPKSRVARPVARLTAATCSLSACRRATRSSSSPSSSVSAERSSSKFIDGSVLICYRRPFYWPCTATASTTARLPFFYELEHQACGRKPCPTRCRPTRWSWRPNGWRRRGAMPHSPIPTPWCSPPSTAAASPRRASCSARKSPRTPAASCSTRITTRARAASSRPIRVPRSYFTGTIATGRCAPKVGSSRSRDAENDAYFRTRPWQSRLGAWASQQSEPVQSRASCSAQPSPRPPVASGFLTAARAARRAQGRHGRGAPPVPLGRLSSARRRRRALGRGRVPHPRPRALDENPRLGQDVGARSTWSVTRLQP